MNMFAGLTWQRGTREGMICDDMVYEPVIPAGMTPKLHGDTQNVPC